MLFDVPMVLHSKQEDGRHWVTVMGIPSLQIWPVAPNHCRVGHFLARLISSKLGSLDCDLPEELTLTRKDVAAVPSFEGQYPELKTKGGSVRLRLVMLGDPDSVQKKAAKAKSGKKVKKADDDDDLAFITPQPPAGWKKDYDQWIVSIGRSLGVDVPEPSDEKGYDQAMAAAEKELQKKLPALRKRFVAGLKGLNLGFKVALPTKNGGKEYVWVRATDWKDAKTLGCVLENQPRNCKGYKMGQKLNLPVSELLDYMIGSQTAGVVESGLTQRIAEDYGLVM